jgi:muramidase (phage lysozyme)
MRKEEKRTVPVVLLILSISLSNVVYAGGESNSPLQSESCQKASQAEGSLINSMSKVLCRQQYENHEDFTDLLREASGIVGPESSAPRRKETPKQHVHVERPPATPPKKHARAQAPGAHRWGRTGFVSSDKSYTQVVKKRQPATRRTKTRVVSDASIRREYKVGTKLHHLNRAQRKELKGKYKSLAKRKDVNKFLGEIQDREGGELLMIVGGTRHKSRDCRKRIAKLKTSGHPRQQGLPGRCFLTTRKYGLSTAAGLYQITNTNWKTLSRLLWLEDFSALNQKIAALELVRTSAVIGSRTGEGLVALVKGDMKTAMRLGVDPWASFPTSRWYDGGSARRSQSAQRKFKRSGKGKYARQQSNDNFRRTTAS